MSSKRKKESIEIRKPEFHRYLLPNGCMIMAGKSDWDNDRLSLKLANADDWWFHVRGMPGSHVLLVCEKGCQPDKESMEAAAAVAAWHSKARFGGVVAVSGTKARYVTKPKGAKPGSVQIRRERIFKVRPKIPVNEEAIS
jgi:predicted ribosome quality control (RQC) complex YloA/Tae2 family protein